MRKIAIFQCDLKVGGIQKALINILNEIDYKSFKVDVFLFDKGSFFDMPQHENLKIISLKPYFWLNRLVYFEFLRRHMPIVVPDEEYDIAIDFNSYRNECSIGTLCTKAKKYVMWIHNDVEIKKKNEIKYRVLWHFFKSKFQYFDEFAAVSPGIIDGFRRTSGIFDKEITPIPNHIDTNEIFIKSREVIDFETDPNYYNLCSMGRLCHQKGFDILLGHFAAVCKRRGDIRLYILGDGPDAKKLQRRIESLGLTDRVWLLGNKENPFPYLAKMDGFALTSRYEGQGLVIWEAKTLGLEIFITKNLEVYNPGIEGREDIESALAGAVRKEKTTDNLDEYNRVIGQRLLRVLQS